MSTICCPLCCRFLIRIYIIINRDAIKITFMYISALSEKLSSSLCRGSITNLNFALGFCGMCDDVSEPYTPAHSYVRCPVVQHIYDIVGGRRLHMKQTIINIWQGRAPNHFPRQIWDYICIWTVYAIDAAR